ncbi:MAG: hypothetical protein A2015_10145 [Spirochaetes bacterium GWF1_31_7]|nr:MAG: hypothetical protein A2Y30_05780 [Spirochaetes bacterium GWE1_32_154]OHD49497.1 MAG: hypothetical protein A2Y29_01840 [Spirochaetes bacterium GWE2_31_10]OHD49691.1 MAG: hypothetical protein A2015_10145 [Spirochaetes bacterium GWF1_31_7]OHD83299.1 MAG: hypothetical protein A2355_01500 [Spirochaetes bacterium RIFOXYB1_FULL_32_8]HBD96238.1 hypothetical protein [Spirochaetia bacterium]
MYTLDDKSNMTNFIRRLLLNPSLPHFNPVESEIIISNFFVANKVIIKKEFKIRSHFQNLNDSEIEKLFYGTLESEILFRTQEKIKVIIYNKIDYSFMKKIKGFHGDIELFKDQIFYLLHSSIKKNSIRKAFIPILRIFQHQIIERYISVLFIQKSSVIDTINKKDRLFLNNDEMINFFKTLSMVSVLGYLYVDNGGTNIHITNSIDKEKSMNTVLAKIEEMNYPIPDSLITFALCANYKDKNIATISPVVKLLRIFLLFGKYYNNEEQNQRGAIDIEQSFFSHYKYDHANYGIDPEILDILYSGHFKN